MSCSTLCTVPRALILKWLPSHGPDLIMSPEQGSQPSGSEEEFDTETKLSKGKYLDTAITVFRIKHAEIAMNLYLED